MLHWLRSTQLLRHTNQLRPLKWLLMFNAARKYKGSPTYTLFFSTVMTSPGPAFHECTGSCHENVPAPKEVSSDLRSPDGLTVLSRINTFTILVYYQTSFNTSHTMKSSDPLLLLADVTLHCGCILQGMLTSLDI